MPHSVRTILKKALHKGAITPADYEKVMRNVIQVRCKDCKYYLHSSEVCGIIDTRLHFYETDKRWYDDCFCSWGELLYVKYNDPNTHNTLDPLKN